MTVPRQRRHRPRGSDRGCAAWCRAPTRSRSTSARELGGEDAARRGDASELLGSLPADSVAAFASADFGERSSEAIDSIDEKGIPGEVPPNQLKSGLKEAGIDIDKIAGIARRRRRLRRRQRRERPRRRRWCSTPRTPSEATEHGLQHRHPAARQRDAGRHRGQRQGQRLLGAQRRTSAPSRWSSPPRASGSRSATACRRPLGRRSTRPSGADPRRRPGLQAKRVNCARRHADHRLRRRRRRRCAWSRAAHRRRGKGRTRGSQALPEQDRLPGDRLRHQGRPVDGEADPRREQVAGRWPAGIGIDLLEIDRLERALERHPRLAERVFTEAERELRRGPRPPRPPPGGPLRRQGGGGQGARPRAAASACARSRSSPASRRPCGSPGAAAEAAAGGRIEISLTHSRDFAAAVAVAESRLGRMEPGCAALRRRGDARGRPLGDRGAGDPRGGADGGRRHGAGRGGRRARAAGAGADRLRQGQQRRRRPGRRPAPGGDGLRGRGAGALRRTSCPADLDAWLAGSGAVVDAIFGTGFEGAPREPAIARDRGDQPLRGAGRRLRHRLRRRCLERRGRGRRGRGRPPSASTRAKVGHRVAPGKGHTGELRVAPIGIPDGAPVEPDGRRDRRRACSAWRRARGAASTKFSSGQVAIAGGSRGLTGAVRMSSLAAIRAGAGYATVAVPADLEPVFEIAQPEVMSVGCPGGDGCLAPGSAKAVLRAFERAAAGVLGPGLGARPRLARAGARGRRRRSRRRW